MSETIPHSADAITLAAKLARMACGSEMVDHYDAYEECQRYADLMRVAAVFIRDQKRRCHAAEAQRDDLLAERQRVRADALEEAAKVAEEPMFGLQPVTSVGFHAKIAAAIRALK